MDTIIVTKTITHISTLQQVQQSLDGIHWLLLFLGWFVYWMQTLITVRKSCPPEHPYFPEWWRENNIEIPLSAICCLILAIWSNYVPTTLIDMKGYISITGMGGLSTAIVNNIITNARPAFLKPKTS